MGVAWEEPVGAVLTRAERSAKYGGATMGGIEPSSTSDNVFIYSDPAKGNKHGYNFDGWDPDEEIFLYTGDGQRGPQKMIGGNKSILDHRSNGKALRLFIAHGVVPKTQTKRHLYIGQFELDDLTHLPAQAPDATGQVREVIVWRLRPVGSDYLRRDHDLSDFATDASLLGHSENVPLEQATVEQFTVASTPERSAQRREAALVDRYAQHLSEAGSAVGRRKIRPAGHLNFLFTDLYDISVGELYEAKATAKRNDVRMAIGQLFDYRRHMPAGTSFTVLLPNRPSADVLDLILSVGFSCVYETTDGFQRFVR